eukprot:1953270-Amphidinium_carterae.1
MPSAQRQTNLIAARLTSLGTHAYGLQVAIHLTPSHMRTTLQAVHNSYHMIVYLICGGCAGVGSLSNLGQTEF